jgi:hypothetical protein
LQVFFLWTPDLLDAGVSIFRESRVSLGERGRLKFSDCSSAGAYAPITGLSVSAGTSNIDQ